MEQCHWNSATGAVPLEQCHWRGVTGTVPLEQCHAHRYFQTNKSEYDCLIQPGADSRWQHTRGWTVEIGQFNTGFIVS